MRPDMVTRSIIPVVLAGVLEIYGLITAVIINGKMDAASCARGSSKSCSFVLYLLTSNGLVHISGHVNIFHHFVSKETANHEDIDEFNVLSRVDTH